MNEAHLHLLVNHVSLFCVAIGAFALAVSMKRKSVDLRVLASALFVVAGIFALITFETGEGAEDVLKTLGGDFRSFIEQHEQAAIWARRSGVLVALLAMTMEWSVWKKKKWSRAMRWVLLVFALHGLTVYAATAYLGGLIRHTEVRGH